MEPLNLLIIFGSSEFNASPTVTMVEEVASHNCFEVLSQHMIPFNRL